jgi:cob(I)alamin adenosyltransferase
MERGLLLVFTGNAEDNAISAVGQVLRSLGAGLRIRVVQFRQGSHEYNELAHLQQFFNTLETHGIAGDHQAVSQLAPGDLWRKAVAILNSVDTDMLVLLGLPYLLDNHIVDERELLDVIRERRAPLHVIVAGGRGLDFLIREADLVTEIDEVKNVLPKVSAENLHA